MMLSTFQDFVKNHDLFFSTENILLSVSGGVDSMVMLDLFIKAGYTIGVGHCNFSLRKAVADNDELFVKDFCVKYNTPFYSKRFCTEEYAKKHGISIQMAARELRRGWFEKLLSEKDFNYYATAHHLNDQAETFLINIMRKTGIAGVHGILPKVGNLIHPLLFATKNDILKYAEENNIAFREDASNLKDVYLRNRIRHQIIPSLNEISPDFVKNLHQNLQSIRSAEIIYKQKVKEVKSKLLKITDNLIIIDSKLLKNLTQAATYLFEILKEYGFNSSVCSNIYGVLNNSGKQFFSENYVVTIDRDRIIINKKNTHKPTIYLINKTQIEIKEPLQLSMEAHLYNNSICIHREKEFANFDYDKLVFPLSIKKWERGDYFVPFGMRNRKKISDYFIDEKFSIPEKQNTWLLCSGENIIWVIGHRIDNRYRINSKTRKVYQIKMKK